MSLKSKPKKSILILIFSSLSDIALIIAISGYRKAPSVEAATSPVNTWVVVDDVEFAANTTADYKIDNLIVAKEATVEVANGETLTVIKLMTIAANATTKGAFDVTEVLVNKGVTLSNSGAIAADSFTNNGSVYNSGSVNLPYGKKVEGNGEWKYNDWTAPETDPDAVSDKQKAMDKAVNEWADGWTIWLTSSETTKYNGNPYDYKAFVTVVNLRSAMKEELINAEFTDKNFAATDAEEPTEFKKAVDTFLATKKADAEAKLYNTKGEYILTSTWTKFTKLYPTEADAKDAMCVSLNAKSNMSLWDNDATLAAYAWYTQDAVYKALTTKFPYAYIWEGCQLDEVMKVVNSASEAAWKVLFGSGDLTLNTMEGIQEWMQYAANCTDTSLNGKNAKAIAEKYAASIKNWKYTDPQVQACGK